MAYLALHCRVSTFASHVSARTICIYLLRALFCIQVKRGRTLFLGCLTFRFSKKNQSFQLSITMWTSRCEAVILTQIPLRNEYIYHSNISTCTSLIVSVLLHFQKSLDHFHHNHHIEWVRSNMLAVPTWYKKEYIVPRRSSPIVHNSYVDSFMRTYIGLPQAYDTYMLLLQPHSWSHLN